MTDEPRTRVEVWRQSYSLVLRWVNPSHRSLVAVLDESGVTFKGTRTVGWDDLREVRWITATPGRGHVHLDAQDYLAFIPFDGRQVRPVRPGELLATWRWGTPLVLAEALIAGPLREVVQAVEDLSSVPVTRLTDPPSPRTGGRRGLDSGGPSE